VLARHNAVDTPALLPDGSIAPTSVSRVLQARGTVLPEATGREDVEDVKKLDPGSEGSDS
jgi:NADH-quinone oxidoreductase subunit J